MNYYNPNYYTSYPYSYNYNNYTGQNTMPPVSTSIPMNQNSMPQQASVIGLNGKIVDGEDVVKATEVPIGGYGIFPKADLSAIYLKSWNNNGTTSIITFKPPEDKPAEILTQSTTTLDDVIKKIDALENKIANLVVSSGSSHQKEEVNKDAFKL